MGISARFDLPAEEAIAWFRDKGLATSFAWQDLWQEEHDLAFTVAKMADVDLLADVRAAVDAAIAEGQTLADFKQALTPKLMKAGWWGQREQVDPLTGEKKLVQLGSARRLETIFRANMSAAYAAGEWAQITETSDTAPFLMYDAVDDNRTRPAHKAWDGLVLRWDDPFWDTHYPPNDYNCRCSAIQLSLRQIRRMGKDGPDPSPKIQTRRWTNRRTGEVMQLPVGVGAGWGYNPGKGGRRRVLQERLREKQEALRG